MSSNTVVGKSCSVGPVAADPAVGRVKRPANSSPAVASSEGDMRGVAVGRKHGIEHVLDGAAAQHQGQALQQGDAVDVMGRQV